MTFISACRFEKICGKYFVADHISRQKLSVKGKGAGAYYMPTATKYNSNTSGT
jgi:hypothetical protein